MMAAGRASQDGRLEMYKTDQTSRLDRYPTSFDDGEIAQCKSF